MKIGIIADTHENMPLIKKAVEFFNSEKVELVLHAGDIISPITFKEFKNLKTKMIAVFGNNDGEKSYLKEKFKGVAQIHEDHYEGEIGGKKFILIHQPRFLDILASSGKYDFIVYGHTHKVDLRKGKTIIINPGECGGWLTGRKSIAILDTETMEVKIKDV